MTAEVKIENAIIISDEHDDANKNIVTKCFDTVGLDIELDSSFFMRSRKTPKPPMKMETKSKM